MWLRECCRARAFLPMLWVSVALSLGAPGQVRNLGHSYQKRPIKVELVALPGEVPPELRPRVLVVAGLNGDHRVGIEVATGLPAWLRAQAAKDEGWKTLLTNAAVEVIPVLNLDGAAAWQLGDKRHFWTNLRPIDNDRDGAVDEDGPDDVDGNGIVTMMRFKHPQGKWRVSDEDPRLMVEADTDAGERGGYRFIDEGIDDDADGRLNEDGIGGVDLDRNFAHGWAEHDPDTGTSAPSEPSTLALIEHVLSNRRIAAAVVLGYGDNLATVPAANKAQGRRPPTGPHKDDLWWWREVSNAWKEIAEPRGVDEDVADGTLHQVLYYQFGIPTFASRTWYRPKLDDNMKLPSGEAPTTEDGRWLALSDAHKSRRLFIDWKPFDHPTLGKVEIGGFIPGSRISPHPNEGTQLLAQHGQLLKEILERLPKLELSQPKVKALGGGVFEIESTLSNAGRFPVTTAMGRQTRSVAPTRVRLDTQGSELVNGDALRRLTDLREAQVMRWLVRGEDEAEVVIRVESEKAGTLEQKVVLQ